ncbi:MAG TPA: hypothetical protein VNW68_06485 [Candidatus Limnocylindria bacterium]|nr:hypothetical protein [Candidatus Limnocylindria bacterium]
MFVHAVDEVPSAPETVAAPTMKPPACTSRVAVGATAVLSRASVGVGLMPVARHRAIAHRAWAVLNTTTTSPVVPDGTAAMASPAIEVSVPAFRCWRTMVAATPPTVTETIDIALVPPALEWTETMMWRSLAAAPRFWLANV